MLAAVDLRLTIAMLTPSTFMRSRRMPRKMSDAGAAKHTCLRVRDRGPKHRSRLAKSRVFLQSASKISVPNVATHLSNLYDGVVSALVWAGPRVWKLHEAAPSSGFFLSEI